jgi:hypothetical protein
MRTMPHLEDLAIVNMFHSYLAASSQPTVSTHITHLTRLQIHDRPALVINLFEAMQCHSLNNLSLEFDVSEPGSLTDGVGAVASVASFVKRWSTSLVYLSMDANKH